MGTFLNIIIGLLLLGWLVGVLGFAIGGLIHLLLVIAVVMFLVRFFTGRRK